MLIGTLTGSVVGYLCFGTLGIFLGGMPGFGLSLLVVRHTTMPAPETINGRFISSAFAVVGAVSQAYRGDGAEACAASETLMDKLQLNAKQRVRARAGLRRSGLRSFNLNDEIAGVARMCDEHGVPRTLFLHMQIHVIAADRQLFKSERDIMQSVVLALGVSEAGLHEVEALFDVRRARREKARAERDQTATATNGLSGAYTVLGVDANATDTEIKKAYRRQMSANHPDKVAGRGLPESIRSIYERKTREVGAAYDRIRSDRGLA